MGCRYSTRAYARPKCSPGEHPSNLTFACNLLISCWRTHAKQLPHLGDLRFAGRFSLLPLRIGLPEWSCRFHRRHFGTIVFPITSSISHSDTQVGLKFSLPHQLAKRVQKTELVIHRLHPSLFRQKSACQFIEDGLTLLGSQCTEIARSDFTVILAKTRRVDQRLITFPGQCKIRQLPCFRSSSFIYNGLST